MNSNQRHKSNMLPDDRFALSMIASEKNIKNILTIKDLYVRLRREIILNVPNISSKKVDEYIIRCIIDGMTVPVTKELKEHILNKGD